LSLTKDIKDFMDKVYRSPLAGNVDSPEAGLDALMQVRISDGERMCAGLSS